MINYSRFVEAGKQFSKAKRYADLFRKTKNTKWFTAYRKAGIKFLRLSLERSVELLTKQEVLDDNRRQGQRFHYGPYEPERCQEIKEIDQ